MDSSRNPESEAAVRSAQMPSNAEMLGATMNDGSPPLFSTWRRLYAAVIGYLAAFVVFLYLFTEYYQILQ